MEVKLCKNVALSQSHVRESRGLKLTLICIKECVFVKMFVPPFSLFQQPQQILTNLADISQNSIQSLKCLYVIAENVCNNK